MSELPKIVAEDKEPEATTPHCPDEVEQRKDSPPESVLKGPMEAPFSDKSDDEFELTWAADCSSEGIFSMFLYFSSSLQH